MNTTAKMNSQLERQARTAASAKLGWCVHALAYVSVNILMALLSSMSGKHWAVFPAMAWGLGLVVHGAVVFLLTDGAGLHERLVQHERDRLTLNSDPW